MDHKTAAGVALAASTAAFAGAPVAPDELAARLGEAQAAPFVLDVRTAEEFAAGRVPGAVNIPVQVLESRLAEVPRDRPIVVYCEVGGRSTRAERLLQARGYDVSQLRGSMAAWRQAGMPVER